MKIENYMTESTVTKCCEIKQTHLSVEWNQINKKPRRSTDALTHGNRCMTSGNTAGVILGAGEAKRA